jgi:hypothetical protein
MRGWPLQQYLLAVSVADAMYSIIMTMLTTLVSFCLWEFNNDKSLNVDLKVCYVNSLLDILLAEYFTSCLALFNIIVEIVVTWQRVVMISKKSNHERAYRPWVICVLIFAFAMAVYSPVLFMSRVRTEETRNETNGAVRRGYFPEKTEFGKSQEGLVIMKLTVLVRMILVIVVLSIVNVVASIKFTAFYKRKLALKEIIRGL